MTILDFKLRIDRCRHRIKADRAIIKRRKAVAKMARAISRIIPHIPVAIEPDCLLIGDPAGARVARASICPRGMSWCVDGGPLGAPTVRAGSPLAVADGALAVIGRTPPRPPPAPVL